MDLDQKAFEAAAEAYLRPIDFDDLQNGFVGDLRAAILAYLTAEPSPGEPRTLADAKFEMGDRVRKMKGSSWQGHIVGFYSTTLTPVGYAVESEREPGSVQIYPDSALEAAPTCNESLQVQEPVQDAGAMPGMEEIEAALTEAKLAYQAERNADRVRLGLWASHDHAPLHVNATAILSLFQPAFATLAEENERLTKRVRELALLLDREMGTPCEQIRHQQEIERLRTAADLAIKQAGDLSEGIANAIGMPWLGDPATGQRLPDDKAIIAACAALASARAQGDEG